MALETCTLGGARLMERDRYGLEPGYNADLVLLDGETLAEAIVSRQPRKLVMKSRRVVQRDGVSVMRAP